MRENSYDYTLKSQSNYFKKTILLNFDFLDGLVLREEITQEDANTLKEFNKELLECLEEIVEDYQR